MTNKYTCILLNEFIVLQAHVLTTVCVANIGNEISRKSLITLFAMKPDAEQSDSGMPSTAFEFTAYSAKQYLNLFLWFI